MIWVNPMVASIESSHVAPIQSCHNSACLYCSSVCPPELVHVVMQWYETILLYLSYKLVVYGTPFQISGTQNWPRDSDLCPDSPFHLCGQSTVFEWRIGFEATSLYKSRYKI